MIQWDVVILWARSKVRGAGMLPVNVLTLPLLSAQSSSFTSLFHSETRPGLQTKPHSTPIPEAAAWETQGKHGPRGFCYDRIQLNFFPVPQYSKHLKRPFLNLRRCKKANDFCMPFLLLRTVCIDSFVGRNGIQFVPWSMRIDSPCHLLPARSSAVILAEHTPLPPDSSGEQLAELGSWNSDNRAVAVPRGKNGPSVHGRVAVTGLQAVASDTRDGRGLAGCLEAAVRAGPANSHCKLFLVTWGLQGFRV